VIRPSLGDTVFVAYVVSALVIFQCSSQDATVGMILGPAECCANWHILDVPHGTRDTSRIGPPSTCTTPCWWSFSFRSRCLVREVAAQHCSWSQWCWLWPHWCRGQAAEWLEKEESADLRRTSKERKEQGGLQTCFLLFSSLTFLA
jgi:hypothetical protein